MKHNKLILLAFTLCLCLCQCTRKPNRTASADLKFSVPPIPVVLTSPAQKAEFVVTHYWDNFNFSDTTLISKPNYTEQAFADFIHILPNVDSSLAGKGVKTLMDKASANKAMYQHFMELCEKYLYDPNSPFRNEDLYITVLESSIANPKLEDIYKLRPRYQLDMALRNRVGTKASDFTYTTEKGNKTRLYSVTGDPLLLFFFRPDCDVCKATKEYIKQSGIDKAVKILSVNPDLDVHLDSIYDLRASPTLYLLDKDKKVLLKDAPIERIEQYLKTGSQE